MCIYGITRVNFASSNAAFMKPPIRGLCAVGNAMNKHTKYFHGNATEILSRDTQEVVKQKYMIWYIFEDEIVTSFLFVLAVYFVMHHEHKTDVISFFYL